jgi:tRNA nucleotidyltransferase (CCA-adding enzyme)
MQRGGLVGREHTLSPMGGWPPPPEVQAINAWVAGIAGFPIRVQPSTYEPDFGGDTVHGAADYGTYRVLVRPQTNDLTILHEVAHLMAYDQTRQPGHTEEWARITHRLYREHLGEEAGRVFARIVWPGEFAVEEASFNDRLHPRDRLGRWVRSLGFKAYKVGGAVRDPLLGKEPKDEDFMVMASPDAIRHAVEAMGARAEDLTVRDRVVGIRAFPPADDPDHPIPSEGIEIAPPRVEVPVAPPVHKRGMFLDPESGFTSVLVGGLDHLPSEVEFDGDEYVRNDPLHVSVLSPRVIDAPREKLPTTPDALPDLTLGQMGLDLHRTEKKGRRTLIAPVEVQGLDEWHDRLRADGVPVPQTPTHVTLYKQPGSKPNAIRTPEEWEEHVTRVGTLDDIGARSRHDFSIAPHPAVMHDLVPDDEDPVGDDARRRDFTSNALYRDLDTNLIVDPTGGLDDVGQNKLVVVGEDSFIEDPLRILRGLRFQSQHGLEPDARTLALMAEHAPQVTALTKKGVSGTARSELDKMLMGENVGTALRTARDTGVLAHFLPELAPTVGFDQQSRYHDLPLDEHIISAVERGAELGAPLDVRLALLFHDSGKPESAWMGEDGHLHFYERPPGTYSDFQDPDDDGAREAHEVIGARIARSALERLNYPAAVTDRVERLVANHMVPTEGGIKAARRWRAKVGPDLVDDLLLHRLADMTAKGEADEGHVEYLSTWTDLVRRAGEEKGAVANPRDLAINGRDLIAAGIPAGPDMGAILRALMDDVHEDPLRNDPDWLIMRALEHAQERGLLQEAFDPRQPRYPKGHPKAGQWRPKIAPGMGRIGPRGMANDLAKLKDLIAQTRSFNGPNAVGTFDLTHIGGEVEKIARRYSTRRAYEQREEHLKAQGEAIRSAHYDRYTALWDPWYKKELEVERMIRDNDRVPKAEDGTEDYDRLQSMIQQHLRARCYGVKPTLQNTLTQEERDRLKAIDDERVKVGKEMEKADRDALLGVLKELRPMGGATLRLADREAFDLDRDEKNTITTRERYNGQWANLNRDFEESMKQVVKLLPRDWLEASNAAGPTRVRFTNQRASHGLRDEEADDEQTKLARRLEGLIKDGAEYVGTFTSTGPFGTVHIVKRASAPLPEGQQPIGPYAPIYDVVRTDDGGMTNAQVILPDWDLEKVDRSALPPLKRRVIRDQRFNPDPAIERYLAEGPREGDFDFNTPKGERPVGEPMEYAGFSDPWHVLRSKDGRLWWANWTGQLQAGVEERDDMSPVDRSNLGVLDRVLPYTFEQTRGVPYEYVSEMRVDPDPSQADVLLHEFAHRLEAVLGDEQGTGLRRLNHLTTVWHQIRTEGENAVLLSEHTGNQAYEAHEVTKPDKFYDAYVGKVYGSREHGGVAYLPTEVLTMGLQNLWFPTWGRNMDSDPDMRHFITGLLAAY